MGCAQGHLAVRAEVSHFKAQSLLEISLLEVSWELGFIGTL